jgi:hypothetical protein
LLFFYCRSFGIGYFHIGMVRVIPATSFGGSSAAAAIFIQQHCRAGLVGCTNDVGLEPDQSFTGSVVCAFLGISCTSFDTGGIF